MNPIGERVTFLRAGSTKKAVVRVGVWSLFFGSICGFAASAAAQEDKAHWVSNIFDPRSTPSHKIHEISLLTLGICAGIFLVVAGLLTYAIFKFRRKPGD